MQRLCALGVLVWSAAATVHAAPPDDGAALPGLVDEPTESGDPAEPETPTTEHEAPTTEPEAPATETTEPEAPTTETTEPEAPTTETIEPEAPGADPQEPAADPTDALADPSAEPAKPPAPSTAPSPPAATTSPPPRPPPSPPPAASKTSTDSNPSRTDPKDDAERSDDDTKRDAKAEDEEDKEPIKHKGFILDFRVGVVGCTRLLCQRHGAKPGLRLDGLMGRNFFGFLDLGLAGAWGRMRANVAPGTDGLALYGLTQEGLPPEAAALMFDEFTVDDAHLETIQAGLDARVHIIPRGRFDPYVGIGAQYNLFRGIYDTPAGETRMGFHGLAFPLQAGFVVFATKRLAFGAQFDYLVTWYGGVTVRGAPGDLGAPIPLIEDAAAEAGVNLPGDLPQLWSAGAVVHVRLGK
ncbi:ribonuclease E domain-containing protein [Paraliomyxa miuraensis]|uniref:hypothetical protein n=1 Tax=Paraliomyxa miuraensis TaxID=376150 RepID=UPI0022552122|nr:hypothetical protein [Paraliomyxa miuraensis]MCX4246527.1 hypothetical protein [Paraliomyxa miuraensis]